MSLNGNSDEELEINYSVKESAKILDYFMDLRRDLKEEFLSENQISISSKDNKSDIHNKIQQVINEEKISYQDIVNYLKILEPLGKQHVLLYNGPEADVKNWRKESYFNNLISANELSKFVDSPLNILPPKTMSISSIEYLTGKKFEVYALERLDHWKRRKEHDENRLIDGEEIELKAVVHRLDRGIIRFKWDLVTNKATLHILQLPTSYNYETIENEFKNLIKSFLDLDKFTKLNLRSVIKKLHKLEKNNGTKETRSHNLNYQSVFGITYGAKSSSNEDSVLSNDELDKAFDTISNKGAGHIGNFFWLPSSVVEIEGNILKEEIHTMILGEEGRINFLSPNREEDINYVLSRVRRLST